MFSLSEFFLILFVALLVLGPNSLQNLLRRIVVLLNKKNQLFTQLQEYWITLKKEQHLAENNKRAEAVDETYKKN